MQTAYFNRFSIDITIDQAESASHVGDCSEDARILAENLSSQLDNISADDIRAELSEYGAWDKEELADDDANRSRIVWIAAGNIVEEEKEN